MNFVKVASGDRRLQRTEVYASHATRDPPCSFRDIFAASQQAPVSVVDSRPILRGVKNPGDFYGLILQLIHGDLGQGWEGQFASARHAAAGWSKVGEIAQLSAPIEDGFGDPRGGFRAVTFDALANALKVLRGGHRPADWRHGWRNRRSRSPTCSCVRYSPRSKASSPRFTASIKRSSSSR